MPARPTRRRAALLALVVLPLALTGCVRYAVDAEISRDNTISGSFVFAAKTEFVEELFENETRFLSELKKQLTADTSESRLLVPMNPARGNVSLSEYRSGDLVGYRQRFDAVPLAELDPSVIRVRHVDDRFIVDMSADVIGLGDLQWERGFDDDSDGDSADSGSLSGGAPRSGLPDEAEDLVAEQLRSEGVDPETVIGDQAPELRIRLTFPGDVISANGTVDDRSVLWQLKFDDTRNLHVSAWDSPRHRSWLPQLFLAICALGGLGVVYQLLRHRLRRRRGSGGLRAEPELESPGFAGLPTLGGDAEAAGPRPGGRVAD